MSDTKLIYAVERSNEHGYDIHKLYVAEYELFDTCKRIEGCVDNKDGYGNIDAANKMGRTFQAMLAAGHTKFYDWAYNHFALTGRYQVYSREITGIQYCTPSFEFSHSWKGAQWGVKLMERIGKVIERKRARERTRANDCKWPPAAVRDDSFKSLQEVTEALDKLGATLTERWVGPVISGNGTWAYPPTFFVPVPKLGR